MKLKLTTARLAQLAAMAMLLFAPMTIGSLAADGARLMNKCKACHTWNSGGKNKLGPNLFGVYGREAGSVVGYRYSKGFVDAQNAIGVWDDQKLDAYLTNPTRYLKAIGGGRSKMNFKLKSPEERRAVIEYVKRLY